MEYQEAKIAKQILDGVATYIRQEMDILINLKMDVKQKALSFMILATLQEAINESIKSIPREDD